MFGATRKYLTKIQLKLNAEDDLEIERVLPLIAMNMRATEHSRVKLSPFEVMYGRQMCVNRETATGARGNTFCGDKKRYHTCLAREMKRLHEAVKERKEAIKLQDKAACDHANQVAIPQWEIRKKSMADWLHEAIVSTWVEYNYYNEPLSRVIHYSRKGEQRRKNMGSVLTDT